MPIIELKKVYNAIEEIKESLHPLNIYEFNEVDCWYTSYKQLLIKEKESGKLNANKG